MPKGKSLMPNISNYAPRDKVRGVRDYIDSNIYASGYELAHVTMDTPFINTSTSFTDVYGMQVAFRMPAFQPVIVQFEATMIGETVNEQCDLRIVTTGDLVLRTRNFNNDRANDLHYPNIMYRMPAQNPTFQPTANSIVWLKVQTKTSNATSDCTIFAGDIFGEFYEPILRVTVA